MLLEHAQMILKEVLERENIGQLVLTGRVFDQVVELAIKNEKNELIKQLLQQSKDLDRAKAEQAIDESFDVSEDEMQAISKLVGSAVNLLAWAY